jgi:uncharacterized membrane-anchored protein YhcB (DUF1043 family)
VLLLVTLMPAFRATTARAEGGIAMSGSFYNQLFQIPQGASASGPSIYVVVFNQSTEEFAVAMSTVAPPEVTIGLSRSSFVLQPGGQQQVQVSVMVSMDAVPGSYVDGLEVSAQATREDTGGIVILGAAAQRTTLEVTGESALVMVDTVSPSGQPVATVVRLFKIINGEPFEFAYNNIGHLEATVSPGSYVASAYNNGDKLAEEAFEVAADEVKQVVLTVNTIFFSLFDINPAYNNETGELGFVQISYTLKNVYQQMLTSTVRLVVTRNGEPIEEIDILNLSPLNLGDFGAPYNYSPADGWKNGTYGFSLRLYVNSQLYAGTQEQTLQVGSDSALPWWILVLAALGGGLIIGGIIMFLRRRKKQDKPEKAQKARKHEKKATPAAGEEAGGIIYGLKHLLSRKGKAAKKPAAPAKATAPVGTGVVVHAAAKKESATAAQAQPAHREAPAIEVTKPIAEKPAVTQAAAAQASPAAKAEAVQPAVAQEAKAVQTTPAAAPKPAQSAAHVKSAADLKKAIASRQSEGATSAATGTTAAQPREAAPSKDYSAAAPGAAPYGTTPATVAAPRRDPLTVPSPFAAPRERPPARKARYGKGTVAGARAPSSVPAATPAAGTGPSAAAVTPETIEPLPVPSPFSAPGQKPYAEKPAPAVPPAAAEMAEAAAMPVEPTMAAAQTAEPEAEPAREPAIEAAASVPAADLDVEPAVMREDVGAETGADTGEPGMPAGSEPEGQAGKSQAQDDEAAKKFVSPIRFLNR